MSNYTVTTDFTAKDALATGNPAKKVKGTEFGTEFTAIATAVNSKADSVSPAFTGATFSVGGVNIVTELGYLSGLTSAIQTQLDAKAPLASPTFTGTANLPANTRLAHMTASRAVYVDANKDIQPANTTLTELNYVNGVTSAIQTQLDAKLATATAASTYAPLASPTFTGTVTLPTSITGAPTFSGLVKARGGGNGLGQITISTLAPSGGANGDLWLKY